MIETENIIPYALFFIGILITLLIPIPIEEEYRLLIITLVIFFFLVTVLSRFGERLKNKDNNIDNLNKRFKTLEDLNDVRLDIRELQREVFKR
jgi:c-di-AMP phosphodiesterase-like protein